MERRAARPSRPAWPALSERFDRRGMGADRAFHPAAALWRPRAEDRHARGHERDPLRAGDRLPWRALPRDFPPRSTVYAYFWEWRRYGVLDRIHHALCCSMITKMCSRVAFITPFAPPSLIPYLVAEFGGNSAALTNRRKTGCVRPIVWR